MRYIIKKIFYNFLIVFFIFLISFFILRKTTDPVTTIIGSKNLTSEKIEIHKKEFGLDGNIIEQFKRYSLSILKLDFGKSYEDLNESVFDIFIFHFCNTLKLSLWSCFFGSFLGIFLGILSKFYNSKKNIFFDIFSIVIISTPSFIIGFLLQYFLAYKLDLFNISYFGDFTDMFLPIATLSLVISAYIFKITQNTIEECLKQPYVKAAYAKGLSKKAVYFKHVFKNALAPILSYIGLMFSFLVSGTAVIEYIFNIRGVGHLIKESFNKQNLNLLQCTIICLSIFITFFNLFLEFILLYINPQLNKKK